jgi:PAS domain-containing protein
MFSLSEVGIVYHARPPHRACQPGHGHLTGYAAPELTALDAAELYADARACVEFERASRRALRQQGRFSGERGCAAATAACCWVQVACAAGRRQRPRGRRHLLLRRRRRAAARARRWPLQAERTRAMLDSVLVGIVTVGEGGIEWMNRSARRMFGGELADFVGEPISIVATPEPDHPLRRTDYLHAWPKARPRPSSAG